MKIALIIIGVLAVLFILLISLSLCLAAKWADTIEGILDQTDEEL